MRLKTMLAVRGSALAIAAAVAVLPTFATAQSAEAGDEAESAKDAVGGETVDEIIVTGFRGSLERSLNIKRQATGITDAITAEDIGKFPDLNISESL